MSWVKLDDQFPDHPKMVAAGGDAAWLYVCGLCYCGRYLTDGSIPKDQVRRLSDRKNPQVLARKLVEVGLWTDDGDRFVVHDYLEYNPAAAKRHEEMRQAKERMANKRRSSPEVRPNNQRTNPERTKMFARSSPSPSPSPSPYVSKSSSSTSESAPNVGLEEEDLQIFNTLAQRKLSTRNGEPLTNPTGWLRTVAEDLRSQHTDRLAGLRASNPSMGADWLADQLMPEPDDGRASAQAAAECTRYNLEQSLNVEQVEPEVFRSGLDEVRAKVRGEGV